jgi:hypothetical protein
MDAKKVPDPRRSMQVRQPYRGVARGAVHDGTQGRLSCRTARPVRSFGIRLPGIAALDAAMPVLAGVR